jgi:hypothetical protein
MRPSQRFGKPVCLFRSLEGVHDNIVKSWVQITSNKDVKVVHAPDLRVVDNLVQYQRMW